MENLQSEVLFIAKFGGIVAVIASHYFSVIKPMVIFNERQKFNKCRIELAESDIEKIKKDQSEQKSRLDILETKHEDKWCDEKRSKNRP